MRRHLASTTLAATLLIAIALPAAAQDAASADRLTRLIAYVDKNGDGTISAVAAEAFAAQRADRAAGAPAPLHRRGVRCILPLMPRPRFLAILLTLLLAGCAADQYQIETCRRILATVVEDAAEIAPLEAAGEGSVRFAFVSP